jgi:hypothetical protein
MKLHFLIAIFLFITISSSNALYCIDADESFEISNDFTFAAVQKAINNLTLDDGYKECLVEIKFDYYNQSIKISFGTAFEPSNLKTNQEVLVQFLMYFASDKQIFNPARINQLVEFACNYTDECDRLFVLDQIKWLFNAKYNELESAIRPLFIANNDNRGKNDVELS